MQNNFAKKLIELKLLAERLIEGRNKQNGLFTISHQVLFVLSAKDSVCPKEIIEKLGIAKSNLAIVAKKLLKDGLIVSKKSKENHKEIYYSITKKGEDVLEQKLNQICQLGGENTRPLDEAIALLNSAKENN